MEKLSYLQILKQNKALSETHFPNNVKIKVLNNITINAVKEVLEYVLRTNNINPEINFGNYDNIVQDSIDCKDFEAVLVFFDLIGIVENYSSYIENINEETYQKLKNKIENELLLVLKNLELNSSVIINSFTSQFFCQNFYKQNTLDRLKNELNVFLQNYNQANLSVVDLDKIMSAIGTDNALDYRMQYTSKAPYSLLFVKKYCNVVEPIISKLKGKYKKALIFDCDNTLWKGIIGEDGLEGIEMGNSTSAGKVFFAVQNIAKMLSQNGVIICLCSKNNEDDVNEALDNHPEMTLQNEDIVIKKINWTDKATNIKEIAKSLNIGLDSLVFVDDSEFEINLINEILPEVDTILVPKNLYEYERTLNDYVNKYFNFKINAEDAKKTQIYKEQIERENEKVQFTSIDDYIASLEISVQILENDLSQLSRIAQMTQKTNQFNLTTYRYSEADITGFFNSVNHTIFAYSIKDKYGDSGITAVVILEKMDDDPKVLIINTFLMSCRIIGRNIEHKIMDHIVEWSSQNYFERIKSTYIKTKKNDQVKDFYSKNGFQTVTSDEDKTVYTIEVLNYKPNDIKYLKLWKQ